MVIVNINNKQYSMDNGIKNELDDLKKLVKKDWDHVIMIDGRERGGKSVFALQLAWYCSDGRLTLNQVALTSKQFREAINKSKPGDAVVYDEAFGGMSSRAAMSKINQSLMKMMRTIGQKNLFVFIVLPSFWDLDKYIPLHRSVGLFHVYTRTDKKRGLLRQRGHFKMYNNNKCIQMIRDIAKWKYSYPVPYTKIGRFANYYPIDEAAYRKKKAETIDEDDSDVVVDRYKLQRDGLWKALQEKGIPPREIAELTNKYGDCDFKANTISKTLVRLKKEGFFLAKPPKFEDSGT